MDLFLSAIMLVLLPAAMFAGGFAAGYRYHENAMGGLLAYLRQVQPRG